MQTPENQFNQFPIKWAAELIKRMRSLYGVKFDQAWANIKPDEIPALWAEQLSGLTGNELAIGLTACRDKEWPPTIPEFRRMCRPWSDPEVAFYLAAKGVGERKSGKMGDWPHPAVYWAAVAVGSHDIANSGYKAIQSRWEAALTSQLAHQKWEPIPTPPVALPEPQKSHSLPKEAQEVIKQIKKTLAIARVFFMRQRLSWFYPLCVCFLFLIR